MTLKRLPNHVQSVLCANSQVNSFKTAVEELVYNAIDAESSSIAIRIHIKEGMIQVIDNGSGVTKHDLNVLGQRYMTSKFIDISSLKTAPKNYGYRGEFLANIIMVSEIVKVTSRHGSTEETWAKSFHNGKEKKIAKMATRPTKGTTVDIKRFLYNQNIQRRNIDSINELQDIKLILNQLSLAHNNISFSLRDDSKNEIIFKIHKKRDIYQTLSTLFDIDTTDVVELQVEKHEYKVKGLIGKINKDLNLQWIYLNGRFIHNCKLHTILNECFKKSLNNKDQRKLKYKKNIDEEQLFKSYLPFYFIFVTCPYLDYDISLKPKQSVLEFKNWEKINKLLEKLVKFYFGDIHLKEIKPEIKVINKDQCNLKCNTDTRDQVKKIMDKILGNNSKKLTISQLQNGVKGKLIKRKKKEPFQNNADIPALFHQMNYKDMSRKRKMETVLREENVENPRIEMIKKSNTSPNILKTRNNKANNPNIKNLNIKEIRIKKRKFKKLSPTIKTSNKQKNELSKPKNRNFKCDGTTMVKKFKETDSICRKSKIVAQKAEDFLQDISKNKAKVAEIKYAHRKGNVVLQHKCYTKNDENIPLSPKINQSIVNKYIINKMKEKSYKTTYDLVQTILKSQQVIHAGKNHMSGTSHSEFSYLNNHKRKGLAHYIPGITRRYTCTNKYIFNSYTNTDGKQEMTEFTDSIPIPYKSFEYDNNVFEYSGFNGQKESPRLKQTICDKTGSIWNYIYCQNIKSRQHEVTYHISYDPHDLLTYDSHGQRDKVPLNNNIAKSHTINTRHSRFITKQSRENFVTSNDLRNKIKKRPSKMILNKQTNIFDIRMRQTIDESYSIQYSNSNENNFNFANNDIFNISKFNYHLKNTDVKNKSDKDAHEDPLNDSNSGYGNTYTIQTSNFPVGNIESKNPTDNQCIELNEPFNTYSIHNSTNTIRSKSRDNTRDKDCHIVFVSMPQPSEAGSQLNTNYTNIEPLNVCETIYDELGTVEKEFAFSFNRNDHSRNSLYDNCVNNDIFFEKEASKIPVRGNDENVSHHFGNIVNIEPNLIQPIENLQDPTPIIINQNDNINEVPRIEKLPNADAKNTLNVNADSGIVDNNFNFKNRPRFMPKGMSQIFENCGSKTTCDYDLVNDYFEDDIYDNFVNDVQVNSEIYEPIIQNVEELTTKNIHKFQNKVKKETASLVFDEQTLKDAKVLGQADCKFIAAIMKKQCSELEEKTEYLILFDQHAVHERIRLENNLKDYIYEDRWTSVSLDNIILKMSKEEIMYLHNYKDKFAQLGLNWTILSDNEVTVNTIPEAILGKNPREVEKVIKAVRNLILEEISVLKSQKGCLSLYPKSIMDLVFSEACRYAIKFGDHLTKNDCVELIKALSDCKTPFQCAHGRPVMAVLMDIKQDQREYTINMVKLNRFKTRNTKNP